jgi:hypothetical protein
MYSHADYEAIEEVKTATHDVAMAERRRIEASRIKTATHAK